VRLLYLCSDFGIDPGGTKGASIHLRAITKALAELGHDVRLLSPKDGPAAPHPARRLLAAGCPPADESSRILKAWMLSRDLGDGLARELRPLVYNAWALERAAALLRSEPVDAIVERLSLHGHLGLDLAEALGVPHVVEVNALLTVEAARFRGLQLPEIAETIETRVLQRADAIVAVSEALAEQIAARGVSRDVIHVVPNGADIEHFANAPSRAECRTRLNLGAEDFVVGFLGTLKPWHGADALVDAFARLAARIAGARLLIVGSGPEESRLAGLAESLGVADRCVFVGAVEHSRVPELLAAIDVATAPYREMDGFYFSPIKLFEYMAAGTCVIASNIGQIHDIIEHERSGLLCPPGDVPALAAALERVHSRPDLRGRLAEAGRQKAIREHSWTAAGRKVEAAIEAAIARRDVAGACGQPARIGA
jgi:glycosyltransferase involved in cell wall biosynthesis